MKTPRIIFSSLFAFLVLVAAGAQESPTTPPLMPMMHMSGLLRLAETIPLPTDGYMDHLAVDVKGQRLFIAGEAARSVLVVDLRAGKVIHETPGLPAMPKKLFYLPDTNEVWLTLTDSSVMAINGAGYDVSKTVKLPAYANPDKGGDNAAYDPGTHLFYAAVEVFTSAEQVESGGGSDHAAGGASIDIVDTRPVPHAAGLDAIHHRLFVGSRMKPHIGEIGGGHQYEPGKLIVMDTQTGKVVQALDSVGGADNVDYDEATGRIYFTGTTGTVAVFQEMDPNHFQLLGKVPTGAIAKSGLWVPELKRFYAAVPKHFVLTPPRHTANIQADLVQELDSKQGAVKPILSNLIVEEARLMVFDYMP